MLSVKPTFAERIFNGTKRFEYRRAIFRRSIDRIVVYASAPVSMVIGELFIGEIISEAPEALWKRTQAHSGITKQEFDAYFTDRSVGYAIQITNATLYSSPRKLDEEYGVTPPQSFMYVGG